ncbi:MAG: hypothetical protein IJF05_00770 [Clostridia bacterium]|nr:hypothetical protein [Clostridia bacterium]
MKKISIILLLALLINLFTACSQSTDKINEGNEDIIPSVKEEPETVKRRHIFRTSAEIKDAIEKEWSVENNFGIICFDEEILQQKWGEYLPPDYDPYGYYEVYGGARYQCDVLLGYYGEETAEWGFSFGQPSAFSCESFNLFNISERLNHQVEICHINVQFYYFYSQFDSQLIEPNKMTASEFERTNRTNLSFFETEEYAAIAQTQDRLHVDVSYDYDDPAFAYDKYGLHFELQIGIKTTYITEELLMSITDIVFDELLSAMILVKTGE